MKTYSSKSAVRFLFVLGSFLVCETVHAAQDKSVKELNDLLCDLEDTNQQITLELLGKDDEIIQLQKEINTLKQEMIPLKETLDKVAMTKGVGSLAGQESAILIQGAESALEDAERALNLVGTLRQNLGVGEDTNEVVCGAVQKQVDDIIQAVNELKANYGLGENKPLDIIRAAINKSKVDITDGHKKYLALTKALSSKPARLAFSKLSVDGGYSDEDIQKISDVFVSLIAKKKYEVKKAIEVVDAIGRKCVDENKTLDELIGNINS